jgi:hypothetical protein
MIGILNIKMEMNDRYCSRKKKSTKCPKQRTIALLFPLLMSLHNQMNAFKCIDVLLLVSSSFIHRQNGKKEAERTYTERRNKDRMMFLLSFSFIES